MMTYEMTIEEREHAIKTLLKGYRRMSPYIEKEFKALGIQVQHTKNHIKLYYNSKLYIAPSSASDWRSGANLASKICRDIRHETRER